MTPGDSSEPAPRGELETVDGLAQLSFLVHGILEREAAHHGLSMIQTRLLGVLRDRAPTMQGLAHLLSLDKSSVTGLVDRAQRRGLVARTPSPTDGRAVHVRLTDAGRALASDVAVRFGAEVTALLEPLPRSDRDMLSRVVSELLVGHASARGIDLFDTDPGAFSETPAVSRAARHRATSAT